jgi:hypothetical protein
MLFEQQSPGSTVTVKLQLVDWPLPVAVTSTVVVPSGKHAPDGHEYVTCKSVALQWFVAKAGGYVTATQLEPQGAVAVRLGAGHCTDKHGGQLLPGSTVTEKAPMVVCPLPVAVTTTGVLPSPKQAPEGVEYVTSRFVGLQ